MIQLRRLIKKASGHTATGFFLCLQIDNIAQRARTTVYLYLIISFQVAAIASPSTTDYNPFETRDQNLFNLIHGQALPTNAALLKKSHSAWSSSLNITNALNIESNSNESIYLDYESYRFNLSYQYGLSDDWDIKLDIPLLHQSGGMFDSAIDHWHELWGLPRANRPFVEHNQYGVRYSIQSQGMIDLNETSTTLGDIQIATALSLLDDKSTTVSIWGTIKLPTGDEEKLSGSGATDLSAWLALNQQLSDHWLINANTGVVILGDDNYKNIPLSEYALYGHVMLGWLVSDSINLKLQLQGHTSYYDRSQLIILGDTYLLNFGGTIKINQYHQLDIAISEDIKVDSSPDTSLIINWRYFPQGGHSSYQ